MDNDMMEMIRGMIQSEIKKAMYSEDDMYADEEGCEYCEGVGCEHCAGEVMEEEGEPSLTVSIIPLGKKKKDEEEVDEYDEYEM